MNKSYFVILFLLAFSCMLIQGKKEEKTTTAVAKGNTNVMEYVQLFKQLLNQALSRADLSSVRGMLSSPLSIGATAVSMLLGGIVLMAFYESPLSPLPVPPLPQAPVGRFPPENPIVAPMNGMGGMRGHHGPMQRLFRESSGSAMHLPNPEQFLQEQHRRMFYQPVDQPQQFIYQKSPTLNSNYQPAVAATSIKRSSTGDVFSYVNQMRNNLKPSNNIDANTYHLVETPLMRGIQPTQDLASAPPSGGVQSSSSSNQLRKDANALKGIDNSNSNLQASASSGHATFVAPSAGDRNSNNNLNINTPANKLNNQLYVQQASPVYRPIDEERPNDKVSLEHYAIKDAIKEHDFDQKQLVHSQLSQIEFKTSPELLKLEESLKRSAE